MRLGLLIAISGTNIDKAISDIRSLVEGYDGRLVFWLKTYDEIKLIEKKPEEI